MKIVSFNINSIRARPHQLEFIRDTIKPDIIGLQETKVHDDEYPLMLSMVLVITPNIGGKKVTMVLRFLVLINQLKL